jgi:hypothetical protein
MQLVSGPPLRRFAAVTILMAIATVISAQEPPRSNSLEIVPESAAFYYASMNHRAQYEAVVQSNAWKRLMDTTIAERMRKAYRSGKRTGWEQFGAGNPFAAYLQGYSESMGSPPARIGLNILKQIFENEVFVYADQDWVDMAEAIQRVSNRVSQRLGEQGQLEPADLLDIASQELVGVNTPTVVIGTVLDDPVQMQSLLGTAEAALDQLFGRLPTGLESFRDAYQVVEEDGLYCLNLQLSAELVPWDELREDDELSMYVDDLKALLDDKTFSLSVSIKEHFLLVSIGPSLDHIRQLGKGRLLAEHEKCAPLRQFSSEKQIVGIAYTSESAALARYHSLPGTIDSLVSVAGMVIENLDDQLDLDGLRDDLETDASRLKAELPVMFSKPGASLSFGFMTDRGIEGYGWRWGDVRLDGSQALGLLDHLGKRPLFAIVGRDKNRDRQFAFSRKWLGRIFDYVQKYVPRNMENDKQAQVLSGFMSELRPALTELANATSEDLLPATEGGAFALVVDCSSRNSKWHTQMPAAHEPVPVPSLALLMEINDVTKIRTAGTRYLQVVSDVFEMVRRLPDSNIPPEIRVHPPSHRQVDGADQYYYALPPEAGLDDSLVPHALLGEQLLILSTCTDQSARLMPASATERDGPIGQHCDQPLMSAMCFSNTELIDAIVAWGRYALEQAHGEGESLAVRFEAENEGLNFTEEEVLEGIDSIIALMKCFDSYSSVTYLEEEAQITHYLLKFTDVND